MFSSTTASGEAFDARKNPEWSDSERARRRAGVPHWTPNQLRHTALTELRERFGADVAQAVAGHRSAKTTEIYASPSAEKARKAMEQVG